MTEQKESVDGDDEEEEYDEESMGEVSGVDAMIEQEIERMIEDGRRTEDENYD